MTSFDPWVYVSCVQSSPQVINPVQGRTRPPSTSLSARYSPSWPLRVRLIFDTPPLCRVTRVAGCDLRRDLSFQHVTSSDATRVAPCDGRRAFCFQQLTLGDQMTDRETTVSFRLSQYHQIAVSRAAQTVGLRPAEWVRLVLRRHLLGEDSMRALLLQTAVALRALLLNVLLYVGPAKRILTPSRLVELWQKIDASSAAKAAKLLTPLGPPAGATQSSVRLHTRLSAEEYVQADQLASRMGVKVAELLRDIVVAQLTDDVLLNVNQYLQNTRMILDEAVRHLTSTGEIPSDVLAELAARTSLDTSLPAEQPDQES